MKYERKSFTVPVAQYDDTHPKSVDWDELFEKKKEKRPVFSIEQMRQMSPPLPPESEEKEETGEREGPTSEGLTEELHCAATETAT